MSGEELRRRFGSRVRALRAERGWSQEALAERAGIDRSYMGGVERGDRNTSLEKIGLIAAALEVTPAELFRFNPDEGAAK